MVFDLGPHFLIVQQDRHKFFCALCETFGTSGGSVLCTALRRVLSKQEYSQEHTPLDSLLYDGSFFTEMPEQFRGLTIQLKPFEFKPSLGDYATSEPILMGYYCDLVSLELFRDDTEILAIYRKKQSTEKKFDLVSAGRFAYDMKDPILAHIISEAERILSDEPMKRLVRRYLRALAICILSGSHTFLYALREYTFEMHLTTLLEKTIAEMLDYRGKYANLTERMSRLALLCTLSRYS